MKKISRIFTVVFLLISASLFSQVGIGTDDPQNDLHVAGGMRIDSRPVGSNQDAALRLVASTVSGDLVNVTIDQAVSNQSIPRVTYNAKFGTNGVTPLFADCDPCADGSARRLFLVDPVTNISNPSFIQLVNPTATNGDEYFRILQTGFYRFEVVAPLQVTGNTYHFVNLELRLDRNNTPTNLNDDFIDRIRIFAGTPAASITGQVNVPTYFNDVRFYEAGQNVMFSVFVALASGGDRTIKGDLPGSATYHGQITVTKI